MSLKEHNPTFPFDGDLDYFVMDYTEEFYQQEDSLHKFDFHRACCEGTFSLWELFETCFQKMCEKNDSEGLRYILKEAPDYKVDLTYSNYYYISKLIKNDSHNALLFFVEQNMLPIDYNFEKYFRQSDFSKNISTSIIETCLFNLKLDNKLEENSTKEKSSKMKI